MKENMSAQEFEEASQSAEIIDVRSPMEYAEGHIPGARNIQISGADFMDDVQQLDRHKEYLLYCRSGSRSGIALQLMRQMGFQHVGHLERGIGSWRGDLVYGTENEPRMAVH